MNQDRTTPIRRRPRGLGRRFMMLFAGAVVYAAVSGCASTPAGAVTIPQRELQPFIGRMVKEHGFSRAKLERLFGRVRMRPGVLAAIRRPAEAKPWFQYRPIFLTSARIRGGVRFWDRYAPILKRAQQRYGVPPQIVTGIIGVETRYGRRMGSIPVLDSLSTLAFDYPPRARFFRSELAQFLLLARDNDLDPLRVKGSYAGAMGMPQFIASSYRRYAVDFDGDGHVDLANSPADAIGSVARYLSAHGWKPGAPVAVPAKVSGDHYRTLLGDNDRRLSDPQRTVTELEAFGIEARGAAADTPGDRPAKLLRLQGRDGPGYWITFHNFYVITRYNHSALYAMAVYQLGRAIRAARERGGE